MNMKKHVVTAEVRCYTDVEVEASDLEEAEKIASEKINEMDFGPLYGIDCEVIQRYECQ